MIQKLFVLFAFFSLTLLFSCSKSDSGDDSNTIKRPGITAVSPEKLYNGTQVTITGENFGTDTVGVSLTLNNVKMVITAITKSSITFTIPTDFILTGDKTCTLELVIQNLVLSKTVTVNFQEPHGWFYAATIPLSDNVNHDRVYRQLLFPTDSIGYAYKDSYLYWTTDGGITWTGQFNNGGFGQGKAFATSDGKNAWVEFTGVVDVTSNVIDWAVPAGAIYNSGIAGLYTSAPANGLVALECGKLLDINGSFVGAPLKYQSIYYTSDSKRVWQKMSAFDKNNLIIADYSINVVIEKGGVFSDVDISSISSDVLVKGLQQVDANTIFLVNGSDEVIKYDGNSWTKLTQKADALYFNTATTGYIAYNDKILKTTDGGASWTEVFTLKASEKAGAICARNGKIWVVGNSDKQSFVLKYNP